MAESPAATDLRGRNPSEDSFTMLMANLVVTYAVDFQSNLFSGAAPVSAVWPEGSGGLLSSLPGTRRTRSRFVSGPTLCEKMDLDQSAGIKLFAYRWVPDRLRSKDWGPAKPRRQSEGLKLIPWDVVWVGQLHLGL